MSRKLSLAWAAVPLLVYLVVLSRLWANAPVWDDYGTVLDTLTRMSDSKSAREWLALLVHQHNEHRIFTVRLVTRAVEALPGPLDFRLLVLLGNAAFVGVFLLAWAQFRESLVGPVVAAAAFVMFQLSYYEAGLWASGGLTNMGAIFFSFAALAVALRPGARPAAACLALATLAIGCSASGLLVLPIAAAGAALQRRTARAAVFAGVAALLWLLYFQGYVKPLHHPSPTVAFSVPLDTMRLFLIVLGSIVPGRDEAQWTGLVLLGAVAALAWKGAWKPHPVAMLWIAFLLLSAAAAAAGRVGFGVFYASRYAIYSTALAVLCVMAFHEITRPWNRATLAAAVIAGASLSLAVSFASWQDVRAFALHGHLLAKARLPGSEPGPAPYFGIYFPNLDYATTALRMAEIQGIYTAPERAVHEASVRYDAAGPRDALIAGHVDEVSARGARVTVRGWSNIPATVPGRVFHVITANPFTAARLEVTERIDAARAVGDPHLVLAGLRL